MIEVSMRFTVTSGGGLPDELERDLRAVWTAMLMRCGEHLKVEIPQGQIIVKQKEVVEI